MFKTQLWGWGLAPVRPRPYLASLPPQPVRSTPGRPCRRGKERGHLAQSGLLLLQRYQATGRRLPACSSHATPSSLASSFPLFIALSSQGWTVSSRLPPLTPSSPVPPPPVWPVPSQGSPGHICASSPSLPFPLSAPFLPSVSRGASRALWPPSPLSLGGPSLIPGSL